MIVTLLEPIDIRSIGIPYVEAIGILELTAISIRSAVVDHIGIQQIVIQLGREMVIRLRKIIIQLDREIVIRLGMTRILPPVIDIHTHLATSILSYDIHRSGAIDYHPVGIPTKDIRTRTFIQHVIGKSKPFRLKRR